MHCRYCGKELDDTAKFCKFCGKSTAVAEPDEPLEDKAPADMADNVPADENPAESVQPADSTPEDSIPAEEEPEAAASVYAEQETAAQETAAQVDEVQEAAASVDAEPEAAAQKDEKPEAATPVAPDEKKPSGAVTISKKTLIIICACIAAAVIVGIVLFMSHDSSKDASEDSGAASVETTEPAEEGTSEPAENESAGNEDPGQTENTGSGDIEIVKSGYSMGEDGYIHYAVVIENTSKSSAYEYPSVIITAYDSDDGVLATEEEMFTQIQPGEKQAYGSYMDCNGENPAKVEFSISQGDNTNASDGALKASDFKIEGAKERVNDGETIVTGKVQNTGSSDIGLVYLTLILKKDKKIIYGESTGVTDLGAGQSKAFEISDYDVPEHDSFEIWVTPNS